jgi:hypothetical protein
VRRRLLLLLAAAGSLLLVARRRSARRERVDLYYDDGSMVTLPHGSEQEQRLLELARNAF